MKVYNDINGRNAFTRFLHKVWAPGDDSLLVLSKNGGNKKYMLDQEGARYFSFQSEELDENDDGNPKDLVIDIAGKKCRIDQNTISQEHVLTEDAAFFNRTKEGTGDYEYATVNSVDKRKFLDAIKYASKGIANRFTVTVTGVAGLGGLQEGFKRSGLIHVLWGAFTPMLPYAMRPKLVEKKMVEQEEENLEESQMVEQEEENLNDSILTSESREVVNGSSFAFEADQSKVPSNNTRQPVLKYARTRAVAIFLWILQSATVLGGAAAMLGLLPWFGGIVALTLTPGIGWVIVGVALLFTIFPGLPSYLWKSGFFVGRLIGVLADMRQKVGNTLYNGATPEQVEEDVAEKCVGVNSLMGRAWIKCKIYVPHYAFRIGRFLAFLVLSLADGIAHAVPKIFSQKTSFDTVKIDNTSKSQSLLFIQIFSRIVANFGKVAVILVIGTVIAVMVMGIIGTSPVTALALINSVSWILSNVVLNVLIPASSIWLPSLGVAVSAAFGTLISLVTASAFNMFIALGAIAIASVLLLYTSIQGAVRATNDGRRSGQKIANWWKDHQERKAVETREAENAILETESEENSHSSTSYSRDHPKNNEESSEGYGNNKDDSDEMDSEQDYLKEENQSIQ